MTMVLSLSYGRAAQYDDRIVDSGDKRINTIIEACNAVIKDEADIRRPRRERVAPACLPGLRRATISEGSARDQLSQSSGSIFLRRDEAGPSRRRASAAV